MLAYNYDTQEWLDGDEGRDALEAQLAEELTLLQGPRGNEYARFLGYVNNTPAIARVLARLGEIQKGAR